MTLPKPEKRKRATPKQKAQILLRQEGKCPECRTKLGGKVAYQIDHIQPLDALGSNSEDNLQALCVSCHKEKTKIDNVRAKKGARLRGETGQLARRIRNGSRLQSRGFDKNAPKQKIPSRPFQSKKNGSANLSGTAK